MQKPHDSNNMTPERNTRKRKKSILMRAQSLVGTRPAITELSPKNFHVPLPYLPKSVRPQRLADGF